MEQLTKIVAIQLRKLEAQLTEAGLVASVTPAARYQLADEGFDPAYGARPLKRIIQQRLANPLATSLLDGRIASGHKLVIDWNGDEFTFDSSAEQTGGSRTSGAVGRENRCTERPKVTKTHSR